MKRHGIVLAALTMLISATAVAQNAAPKVYSDAGNIYIERGGAKNGARSKLTSSEMDLEPALTPAGDAVVYTRQGRGRTPHDYDGVRTCTTEPRPDELREINADGTGDKLLLNGRKGDPERQVCGFHDKQFSSDGRRLYFLTPAWVVSRALHVLDLRSGAERFVMPANDLLVLNFCTNKYKDYLAVRQHRYFFLGGSYDWYWLYDPTGKKELGPLGDFASRDDLIRQARGVWCADKS